MSKFLALAVVLSVVVMANQQTPHEVTPVFGTTNPSPQEAAEAKIKRFGTVIELRGEKEQHYRKLHGNVWPDVVAAVKKANIQNYSIYVAKIDGKKFLFSYLEYIGDDPETDMAKVGNDSTVKNKWWPLTDACQKRLPGTPEGKQWQDMEMIMHIQ